MYGSDAYTLLDLKKEVRMDYKRKCVFLREDALERVTRARVDQRWKDRTFKTGNKIPYKTDIEQFKTKLSGRMSAIVLPGAFVENGSLLYLRAHKNGELKVVLKDATTLFAEELATAIVKELGHPFEAVFVEMSPVMKRTAAEDAASQGCTILQTGNEPKPECQMCHVVTKLRYCTTCKSAGYCSEACQLQDWVQHKRYCKPRVAEEVKAGAGEQKAGAGEQKAGASERAKKKRAKYKAKAKASATADTAGAGKPETGALDDVD